VLANDPPDAERPATAAEAKPQPEEGAGVTPAEEVPAAAPVATAAGAKPQREEDAKALDGMSVLGNQEAPKALVIVPWKSSEIGASLGSSTMLDDSRQPIDKEVFMRVLSYYEVRSTTTSHDAAQPAAAPHRR
jgi:hypothetical protein